MSGADEKPHFTDAVGKTVPRPFVPPQVASPINLLNPDRYEFYTFNDNGELVKRLMTLKEIQSIVANGNGATIGDNEPESQSVLLNTIPLSNHGAETKVQDIVDSVQNVLSREMENNKNASAIPAQLLDTPDVSSSWSMILPAIFGNTGDEILPHKPINMTPETEIVDTTTTPTVATRRSTTTRAPPTTRGPTSTRITQTTKTGTRFPSRPAPETRFPVRTTLETFTHSTTLESRSPTDSMEDIVEPTTSHKTTQQIFSSTPTKVAPTTTKAHPVTTKAQVTSTKAQSTSTKAQPTPTKKQTTKLRLKPTTTFLRTTTAQPIETTPEEVIRTTLPQTSTFKVTPESTVKTTQMQSTTVKVSPTKKIVKKPTASYKRPLTNSPIIIEKIPKRPLPVEAKTEGIEIESKTESFTLTPAASTYALKPESLNTVSFSVAPSTVVTTKKTTLATRTEAPSSTTTRHEMTSEKPKSSSTTKRIETTQFMLDKTTLSASEEDRQDFAINQIIGSLQSDLFKPYEVKTTTNLPMEETTVKELVMEKIGDFNLIPDKVLLNDQLFIDEEEPIVKDLPTTTMTPIRIETIDTPTYEKLEAISVTTPELDLGTSEVMSTIEKLLADNQGRPKNKPEKLDILAFDDDDETDFILKGTLESKKNLTHSDYITKAATVASILNSKFFETTTATTEMPSEESDTTVPTILSDALSDVIKLMIEEQESKKTTTSTTTTTTTTQRPSTSTTNQRPSTTTTTQRPSTTTTTQRPSTTTTTTQRPLDEPSEFDLIKLLQHYEELNTRRNELESLSQIKEKLLTTTERVVEPTNPPRATVPFRHTTRKPVTFAPLPEENVSVETMVVKETSSVSLKKGTATEMVKIEMTTMEPEEMYTTTDANNEEFSTFFFIGDDDDNSSDQDDGLGAFTTEQFVMTEKRLIDRKQDYYTTIQPPTTASESDEESGEFVSGILNAIGIASDEEEEASTEKFKDVTESQESDEVESAIKTLTSTINKTLTSVKTKEINEAISSLSSTLGKTTTGVKTGVESAISSLSSSIDKTLSKGVTSLSSTIDKTLVTDVNSDLSLTSKIASGLFSVADTITDTFDVTEESEEATTEVPTTEFRVETTTEKFLPTDKVIPVMKNSKATKKHLTKRPTTTTTVKPEESTTLEESTEFFTEMVTEAEKTAKKEVDEKSPMLQLSIIRKDNSLEQIDFITPPNPTSTQIPVNEGNFIKIESIGTTSNPKLSGFKNKGQDINEHVKPIYVSLRTTTSKAEPTTTEAISSEPKSDEQTAKLEEIATERVPLIVVSQAVDTPASSTEDNLVEIKVQTKPTVAIPTTTEHHSTNSQHQPNAQTIKNIIKISQQQTARPQLPPVELSVAPKEALGLAVSTANLNSDLREFSKLCNELAFSFWKSITADGISQSRSVIISPFSLTSTLSMIFLGARGQTSGEMNDLLKLDDMVTFNPHVIFRNISESIEQSRNSGIAAAAFVRELYSDRNKGKLLPYFKEKAQQFYGAHVEEVNFDVINDILRRRTNLLVKRHTLGKINEYLKTNNIWVNEPLAAVAANVFLVRISLSCECLA